jgi:hypothetical protein
MNCHLNYIKLFYSFPTILIDNEKVKKTTWGGVNTCTIMRSSL